MTAQSPHRLNPAPLTAITGIIAKCSCPVTALLRVLQRLLTEGLPISDQPRPCALRGLSLLSLPSASHAAQPCSLPSRPTGLSSVPWRWDDLSAPGLWLMPLPLPALAAFKPLLPGSSKSQHGF